MSQEVEQGLRVPRQAETLEQFAPRLCGLPGWENYSAGQLWPALKEITRAVAANEDAGRNWELMGLIFRDMAKPKSAINAFEQASVLVPLHPFSSLCLAECYGSIGKRELARDLYLVQAESEQVMASTDLMLLVASGLEGVDEPHLAMELCRKASQLDPDSGQAAYDMCFYASRCGAQPALIESLAWRAVELEPRNVHFRVGLASLLIRMHRFDKAYWVVSSLTKCQICDITCECCLERIERLFEFRGDEGRAAVCRQRAHFLTHAKSESR